MKKLTLLKSTLLLCALVVGSTSMWAIDVTATLTGTALATAPVDSYSDHTTPLVDNKGNKYVGNWYNAQKSGTWYNMIQLNALGSGNTSHISLPKYDGRIKTITLSVTSSSGTSAEQSSKEAKVKMNVVNGSTYTKADVTANGILEVNHSTDATKSFEISFDFTTLLSNYDGEGLYICSTSGSLRIWEMVVVYEVTTVPATITDAEYATFVSPYATDFSTTGISVYTATDEEKQVTLNAITSGKVPANTPVVLHKAGADGTPINVPVVASADTPAGTNDLRVSTGTDVPYMYVLSKKNGKVGFRAWTGTDLSAGKIYLQGKASYGAREFLGFGDVTAINKVEVKKAENGVFFNLAGQQVAQPSKGLYIMNGRKVIVK